MDVFPDHYRILGIPPFSSLNEIKKAFWKLAKIHHPDKNGNPEKFYEIYTSYKFLQDPEKKKLYDTLYSKWLFGKNRHTRRNYRIIPAKNIYYTATLKKFLEENINLKHIKNSERKLLAKITYDFLVFLEKDDFHKNLILMIPVIVETPCSICRGSDPFCSHCNGRGYRNQNKIIPVMIPEYSLADNQILGVDMEKLVREGRPKQKRVKIMIQFR